MAKPLVQLYDAVGFGLIVDYPSGIVWSNQVGGTRCLHPELEGVYVPLGNDLTPDGRLLGPELDLTKHFTGPVHRSAGAVGLTEADLDFVARVLERARLADWIELDRSRAAESCEAWVHARLLSEQPVEPFLRLFQGLGPYPRPAVLTWGNSD